MTLTHNGKDYGEILFQVIAGSHSHGTNIPESDIDIKGVYVQSPDSLYWNGYKEQIEVDKDTVFYELNRFISLCRTSNPTMLEVLFTPKDCIQVVHPAFQPILDNRDVFLSKDCVHAFTGYAHSQVKKAGGLQKMMNWEYSAKIRKTPLDFTYVIEGVSSKKIEQRFSPDFLNNAGLSKCQNGRGLFCLYLDNDNHFQFKGVVSEKSNELLSQEIPKEWFLFYKGWNTYIVWFDQDGYSRHCKRYNQYQKWLEKRNTQRYVDVAGHNQKIDGKNLLHCTRIIQMGLELAQGEGFNVRRPDAEYLISIRRGEVSLQEVLDKAEESIIAMKEAFKESSLPDKVDSKTVNELLIQTKEIYYDSTGFN